MKSTDPELRKLRVCFVDNGLFMHFAIRLSKFFDNVSYFCSHQTAFQKSNRTEIGAGYPEIKHLDAFWDTAKDYDLFIFPDIGFADWQIHLRRDMKKNVWGAGDGEILETNRYRTKQLLRKLKLPVGEFERCIGMKALRSFLKAHEDKYIKISRTRGDTETFHHKRYELSAPKLDEMEHSLGAMAGIKEFIVEDPVPAIAEIGYDGWTIDGKFPDIGFYGIEVKDQCLVGTVMPYVKLPEDLRHINETLAPVFKYHTYRGFWSSEIRVGEKDKKGYLIDPTCRCPSPPGELESEIYGNWDEVMWYGAQGEVVRPKALAKYGVQAIIVSDFGSRHWEAVRFPEKIKQWVKLLNSRKIDGVDYVIPQENESDIMGSVVAIDNTLLGAVKKLKGYAKEVELFGGTVKVDTIGLSIAEIQKGIDAGIPFSNDKLPSKEEIDNV